ncbi:SRPBCC family protein [Croceivirga lutea]|uniref:SRPBCC family protein n=1 Tax=Croceivirga lutea TaxID=1775167 RepID=UPI001639CC01|nr:SRPBCC family protein [Croceivirga lutea]
MLAKLSLFMLPLVIIAQNNPDKTFVESVVLETSPENAWSAITDFSNFNSWDSNVVAVKCPEELKNNQVCQMISNTGELIEVELVDRVENEFYIIRYKLSSGNFFIKRSIENTDNVTITETAWFTGISKKTFEKYKGEDYASFMKNRMQSFKVYLEEDYGK